MEIGNSVFMQYVKRADGGFDNLPQQNVDFGGGLGLDFALTSHTAVFTNGYTAFGIALALKLGF